MALPVTIENEALRLQVWPQFGGKIASVIDKADGFELMFNYPAELPETSLYGRSYFDAWNAGWDECFPSIAPGLYPRHPYEGVNIPDHGELWGLPTTAVPTKDGITTVSHGLRFGYTFSRKLHLDGSAIVADYTLLNRAPFEFRFVWSAHPSMSMNVPVEIDLASGAAGRSSGSSWRLSHGTEGPDVQRLFDWPNVGEETNLSVLSSLPDKGAWKAFSLEPISGPAVIRYPTRGRHVTLEYDSDAADEANGTTGGLTAYWAVWITTGGWEAQRHFSVEPVTGRFDDVIRCAKDHSVGSVAPLGRRVWRFRFTVG